jgi:hypothetical protein
MTLAELIATFRAQADDIAEPYLWDDEWLAVRFTEAQDEAAIRSRLLHESTNTTICQIAVTAGTSVYPLHAALYEIDYLAFKKDGASCRTPVNLVSREALDARCPDWREKTGEVEYAIQSDTLIRLAYTPESAGTLYLEGYRLPLKVLANDGDKPELHKAHHIHLVQWVLHKAFSIPDADKFDANRAREAEQKFTAYFGIRPDADLRRMTQEDVPQTVKAFWP